MSLEINSQRNNIKYLEKREIFLRFAFLSADWLQFGQNSTNINIENNFALDFAFKIVTKQLINKQN